MADKPQVQTLTVIKPWVDEQVTITPGHLLTQCPKCGSEAGWDGPISSYYWNKWMIQFTCKTCNYLHQQKPLDERRGA